MLSYILFAIPMAYGIVYFYAKTTETLLIHPYIAWLAAVNATAFLSFVLDKILAVLKPLITPLPRIPEKLLLLLTSIGGFIGAWLGMILMNHKTNKQEHRIFLIVILLAAGLHAYVLYLIMNNRLDVTPLASIMTRLTWMLKELKLP